MVYLLTFGLNVLYHTWILWDLWVCGQHIGHVGLEPQWEPVLASRQKTYLRGDLQIPMGANKIHLDVPGS